MPISPRDKKRVQHLHARLGSQYAGEQEAARKMLDELLTKLRLTWNDLPELLTPSNDSVTNANDDPPDDQSVATPTALALVHHMLQEFIDLKSSEYVAVALWVLHTFVFDRFLVTPRLAIVSPVRGCGKTTFLATLEYLTARSLRTDGISPASLYHIIDEAQHRTMLIDEADNADLGHNGLLRAVLNSGHRKGGGITRMVDGAPKRFSTFAPVAIAAIHTLPLPIMARSVAIHMQRSDGTKNLRRLDDIHAAADLDLAYRHALMWARTIELDPNPELPSMLRNRASDNWRVLIAIGDSFGQHWGVVARDAAIALAQDSDEDVSVLLLMDTRSIFDELRVDRISSRELLNHLVNIEDSDWGEFRGPHGNQSPRALSIGQLASLLKPFGIRSRSIRILGHRYEGTQKGYLRSQFETAWARYCPEAGTTAPTGKIKYLREV